MVAIVAALLLLSVAFALLLVVAITVMPVATWTLLMVPVMRVAIEAVFVLILLPTLLVILFLFISGLITSLTVMVGAGVAIEGLLPFGVGVCILLVALLRYDLIVLVMLPFCIRVCLRYI